MKFDFEVTDRGKTRRGSVEGADREQALAALELKGYRVEKLESQTGQGPSRMSSWSVASLALCALGLVAALWSALLGRDTPKAPKGQQLLVLEVQGQLQGDLKTVDRVSVLFPQLPARIEGNWTEVGQADGSYQMRRELTTTESCPLYFHLKVTDAQGDVLAESPQNRFDPSTGKGQVGSLTLESPE